MDDRAVANRRLMWRIAGIAIVMFGFGFALVPFYDALCRLTGLNGKTSEEAASDKTYTVDATRSIELAFIASVNEQTPLKFRVETPKLTVHPGQYYTVNFFAENTSPTPLEARAVPSVTPGLAAEYLQKTQCFCFTRQTFEPGQERKLPVRFVIKPTLPKDVNDMALSYTFFNVTGK